MTTAWMPEVCSSARARQDGHRLPQPSRGSNSSPHHGLSHHGNNPAQMAKLVKINTLHMEQFAYFLEKLKATPDGDGSVLDHSLIFYGGGMGNPNGHASDPLPVVAIGGGVGKGHRHIKLKPQTPIGNLWLAVANHFGDEMTTFGDSNGRVEDFFA